MVLNYLLHGKTGVFPTPFLVRIPPSPSFTLFTAEREGFVPLFLIHLRQAQVHKNAGRGSRSVSDRLRALRRSHPSLSRKLISSLLRSCVVICGEGGIRTLGPLLGGQHISSVPHSTTLAPLHIFLHRSPIVIEHYPLDPCPPLAGL